MMSLFVFTRSHRAIAIFAMIFFMMMVVCTHALAIEKKPFARRQWVSPSCLVRVLEQEQALTEPAVKTAVPVIRDTQVDVNPPYMSATATFADREREKILGAFINAPPTQRAPPVEKIGSNGARILADEVTVGPVTFQAPEVRYVPHFAGKKEELARTIAGPRATGGVQKVEAMPEADAAAAPAWQVDKHRTLEFNMPVIEEKIAGAWGKVHGVAEAKPLGKLLGQGKFKWVYEDPYDPDWVIKVMRPGGYEGQTIEEIGSVALKTAKEFRHERESDLLMRELLELHRREMRSSGQVTSIEVLERQYPEEAARYGSYREKRMPSDAIDIRKFMRDHPDLDLENHPDFKNVAQFVKKYHGLKYKHRLERGLVGGVAYVPFECREAAAKSLQCRFFGFPVPDTTSESVITEVVDGRRIQKKVIEWRVLMGIDVQGEMNLAVKPLPGNRYRFYFPDHS